MGTNDYDTGIVSLLISPRWRLLRHIVLLTLALLVAAGMVWQGEDGTLGLDGNYFVLSAYAFTFLGGYYLNIYILTPRLLLRGRWGAYFCSLLGFVLALMVVLILYQLMSKEAYGEFLQSVDWQAIIVSIMSATLSLCFLFAGTTTLVLLKNQIQDMRQSEELESATLQMELKLLENQINPHFLFNMLNNANVMISKDPAVASHIIGKLEEMLRYQIIDRSRKEVRLAEEVSFLSDYLELEKIRRDYFTCAITREGEPDDVRIPPLLFITFVENAVKHSRDSRGESHVQVSFELKEGELTFLCRNSLPANTADRQKGGIGLANIRRRLELLYGDGYSLEQIKTNTTYTVVLKLTI